jgi:hypothetical protein
LLLPARIGELVHVAGDAFEKMADGFKQ